jgi:hypothetical protein
MRSRRFPAFVTLLGLAGAIHIGSGACRSVDDYVAPPTEAATAIASTTATLLSSSSAQVPEREELVLTATVHAMARGAGTPRGTVMFSSGTKVLADVPLDSTGVARYASSTLQAGDHRIVATYLGASGFDSSDASMLLRVTEPGV